MSYKLLFIAYSCEPGRGSEWGLGWSYVKDLSRTQEVWLITHAENRPGMEKYLREKHDGFPVHVTYVKTWALFSWMNCSIYTLFNLYYYIWQFFAASAARKLHRQVKFDLTQHVSLFRWWMPSAGATLADRGVGFIFGPVGGGDRMPAKFRRNTSFLTKFADLIRLTGREIWRHDPILRHTIRKAHIVLAGTESTAQFVEKMDHQRVEALCAAAAADEATVAEARKARAARDRNQPFTITSCGGLSYYRGVDLALKAFAKANLPSARYVHVCNGPARASLEQLAKDLNIADRVEFAGDMPNVDCLKLVAQADLFSHTVLRDSQGVTCEALLMGIPVVVLDHLTPGLIVTPGCGYKIPISDSSDPDQVVNDLAQTYRSAYEHRAELEAMAPACIARGEQFTPTGRGKTYRAIYDRVLAEMNHAEVEEAVPAKL